MTIDERLEALTERHEALTMTVELLSRNQEAMQATQAAMQAAQADIHNSHAELQQDMKTLLRSQVLMSEGIEKLATRITELADVQRHTDERMDALILTVDQIVRGRNGGPKA